METIIALLTLLFLCGFALNRQARIVILKRDKFRCQHPGCRRHWSQGFMIEIHHIKPQSRGGSDHASNLTSLCRPHHLLAHKKLNDPYGASLIQERIDEQGIMREGFGFQLE